ncbi:MAG: TetR family transcriptional regulator [Crocinitomicaceae bacterium]|nr:TetR family transcriptional regulator [Crocinitomicaceae bacterium]|tara:strand:- start:7731 stop:8411 length:681 start_codon:yes stop_codon:yes gene_type:complete
MIQEIPGNVRIQVPEQLFLKDPDSSELGKRIVKNAIDMIYELGFENFTFKKLGQQIGSSESTVYRYFENKHKLLVYLINWYWGWIEYRMSFAIANLPDASDQLKAALKVVTEEVVEDSSFSHVNEVLLYKIVFSESSKAYLTKDVDNENKQGYFKSYKRLCERISSIVLTINPQYPHAKTLVSTIIEGSHLQKFFSIHLPSLTNCDKNSCDDTDFFTDMAFSLIQK